MMVKTIQDQVRWIHARMAGPELPGDLFPALTFNPLLPGQAPHPTTASGNPDELPKVVRRLPADEAGIAYASIAELSHWLRTRELTSVKLTRLYLDRLRKHDDKLHCVITLMEDDALIQASAADREMDAGQWRGPLHGIPWGAKDLLDTAGVKTTWGAETQKDRVPDTTAVVIERLNEAGAVLVAKLSLGALAYKRHLVRRPYEQSMESRRGFQWIQRRIRLRYGGRSGWIRTRYRNLRLHRLAIPAMRHGRASTYIRARAQRWCNGAVLVVGQDRSHRATRR